VIELHDSVEVEPLLEALGLDCFVKVENISDGSHRFVDLYNHRDTLFLCLVKLVFERGYTLGYKACKSKLHADGTNFEGYFIVMVTDLLSKEQISYHLNIEKYWDLCDLEEVEKAPEWDGHSSDDVIARLTKWFL